MKKSQRYLAGLFIISLCGFLGLWLFFLFSPIISKEKGLTYYLRPGTSKKLLVESLSQEGIITHPALFSLYLYLHPNAQLKTGEYLFPKGSTPVSLWGQVTSGTGQVNHHFTIIPGWSFTQLRHALLQAPAMRHVTKDMEDRQIMLRLGKPELAPEGEFFPETYYYTYGNSDLVILKRAYDLMQARLNDAWQHRAPGLPYKNAYEALIAASLVEKEAFLNTERPVIAGVIMNRLRKDMLLQIDPTVIYGLGNRYDGKIHKADLTEDTVYNTYVHKGLPPTPIAMPGMSSIEAATHPQEHNYFYFVAKGDGSHQFSATLVEHNAAVATSISNSHSSWYFNEAKVKKYLHALINQQLKNASRDGILPITS